jgi:predicted glycosyltransferase
MPTSPRLSPEVLVPRRSSSGAGSGPRVAFYSHDTQGLGHVRRNSLLAAALVAEHPDVNVLLLSGASEAGALPLPDRTDIVTVPGLAKDVTGRYRARELDCSLEQVLAVRSAALESVLVNFAPDLLVVDKVPRGILGELEPGLRRVRREHGTRTVLGLRDVLDDVTTTRREWRDSRSREAIRSLYDQVWVYGDDAVFDPAEVYGWTSDVRKKVRYTGYLGAGRDQLLPVRPASHGAPSVLGEIPRPFVLGLVGGGQDGAAVADAFARTTFPEGHLGVLVTGPYLPADDLEAVEKLAADRDDLRVYRFVGDVPALVKASSATVSMGGYNSVCELMAARRPALVVPRVVPRLEQALRAEHLARRGLLDVLSADRLEPARLAAWLRDAVTGSRRSFTSVDLQGLQRVAGLAVDLIDQLPQGGARHAG